MKGRLDRRKGDRVVMPLNELLERTLASLRETRRTLMSQEWDDEIAGQSPEEKRKAAATLSSVQKAILALENTELANIRDKLTENEKALTRGTRNLKKTLVDLEDVKKVLEAVNGFLQIVARIAPMFI
jgi:hypothetical protein